MPDTAAPHVLYEKRDGIATVTLNRPDKRNAFSPEMIVRLVRIWAEVAADPEGRVVLLTAAGTQAFTDGLGGTIFGTGVLAADLAKAAGWAINLAIAESAIRCPARQRPALPTSPQQAGALS